MSIPATPLIAAAAVAAALAACAPTPPPPGPLAAGAPRQCFFTREANGFSAVDERLVNVRVGVREVWQLEMAGRCLDVDWANRIALTSRGSSNICEGHDALLVVPSRTYGRQRCLVRNVRKLSDAEVAALPPGEKP